MRLFGAVLGAIIAPVLMVVFVSMVHRPPATENWDYGTPALMLMAGSVLLIAGAIAGAVVASALARGDTSLVRTVSGVMLVLIAALPAFLVYLRYAPEGVSRPASVKEQERWAERLIDHHRKYGFAEEQGRSLAGRLRTAMRTGGLASIEWRQFSRIREEAVAARGNAYRVGDDGWRWDMGEASDQRTIVFPDPLLKRDGPVFEISDQHIYRRETRSAAPYSTDSALVAMLRLPDCIARFAQTARAEGTWDGNAESLTALIAERWQVTGDCPRILSDSPAERFGLPWRFRVRGGVAGWQSFTLTPEAGDDATPFRFEFMADGRGFLRDASGGWHMRAHGAARLEDRPPPRCYFDLTIPCEV